MPYPCRGCCASESRTRYPCSVIRIIICDIYRMAKYDVKPRQAQDRGPRPRRFSLAQTRLLAKGLAIGNYGSPTQPGRISSTVQRRVCGTMLTGTRGGCADLAQLRFSSFRSGILLWDDPSRDRPRRLATCKTPSQQY